MKNMIPFFIINDIMYKRTNKHQLRKINGIRKSSRMVEQLKSDQDKLELLPTENVKIHYPKFRVGQRPGTLGGKAKRNKIVKSQEYLDRQLEKIKRLKALREANTNYLKKERQKFEIQSDLLDIRKRKQEQSQQRRNSNIADGYIYFIVCKSFDGWTKIGHTSDYIKRLQTYQTGSPFADYEMIGKYYVENRVLVEKHLLTIMNNMFIVSGEWVKADAQQLIKIFENLYFLDK